MNKVKVLTILVSLLVVINLVLMAMFLLRPKGPMPDRMPHGHDQKGPEKILIESLQFNKEQMMDFQDLMKEHQSALEHLNKSLNKEHKALFDLLKKSSFNNDARDSIQNKINEIHTLINTLNIDHFQDIKKLCNEDQQQLFVSFIDQMSRRFVHPNERPGNPPR